LQSKAIICKYTKLGSQFFPDVFLFLDTLSICGLFGPEFGTYKFKDFHPRLPLCDNRSPIATTTITIHDIPKMLIKVLIRLSYVSFDRL
jgi:hypothetical protein